MTSLLTAPPATPATDDSSAPASRSASPPEKGRRRIPTGPGLLRWLSPVAIIIVWQLASYLGLLPERILPAPQLIAEAGWELTRSGQLGEALLISTGRVLQGLALGIAEAELIEPFTFADFVDTRYAPDLEPYFDEP